MMARNFNYPDLDVLESPLMSSAPLTAVFSNIPGSAIAERIFNDPESWGDDDDDDGDFPEDEQLTFWAEELEIAREKSTGVQDSKGNALVATHASALPQRLLKRDPSIVWKGKALGKRGAVRPISLAALFEHTTEDFSGEIQQQLTKILDSGGIPHHIRYPHSSALSPPSTSDTTSTLDSPLQIQTASSVGSGGDKSPSPVAIYSASATLSFLEWYGIYPDSPRLDLHAVRSMQPKSARFKAPTLQIPSPRRPSRPASMLGTPLAETPVARQLKRSSSVPPPGLDIPADVQPETRPANPPARTRSPTPPARTHSPSPIPRSQQVRAAATVLPPLPTPAPVLPPNKERGRSLVPTEPPPYSQTLSRSDSAPSSRRRLPSIPPESTSSSQSSTPSRPPVHIESSAQASRPRACSRNATPPPVPCTAAQGHNSPALRLSSVRSPQSGPAGPRTRGRGSRDSSGTPGISVITATYYRPPGLKL
ncbi:hypothetical protein HYPSUDRAFT_38403 [Hypholoma sublateritium FD-334 SS-4]|uniref:Uncharacterized protein n=1 Tax=Hypholoma sublateritium (strain FD-334 SS-4) TaxID=945553 RepID=A0A0D2PZE8_HYPSF|nr:hypothetical protein HYPSUDRAFT_38403 [Hypholoma sublateritium FD-334 SS-4]